MLKHMQKSRLGRAWPVQAIRSLGRQHKTAIPNPHKKVITIPTIRDNEIIRFKPSISVKDDLIHGGIPKYEIEEEYGEDEDDDDDDDDEITIGNRASKAILQYGRVRSRHIDAPPDYLRDRARQVCDQRTTNQIHRLVKSWMVKHDLDRTNRYRKATLGWGPHNEAGKLQQAEDEKYREKEQRFVYGPNETMVYSSFHMPARFSILRRIFDDIKTFQPDFVPHRMLDFGCGPATAGLAAHAVWGANEDAVFPIQQYSGVDLSQGMLDAARIMVKDVLPNHLFFSRSLDVMQRAVKRGERYSFIVCSYTLSELPSDAARQAAVQMLYELLAKDGIVVFVEHGDNHGSHTVRTARHYLQALTQSVDKRGKFSFASLDSKIPQGLGQPLRTPETPPESSMMLPLVPGEFSSYADMGARTLAPCTHDEVCPLYPGKKCTFMQRVSGGLIRKNAEEKFAYAVLQKVSKSETTAATTRVKAAAKGQATTAEGAEEDTVDALMKKASPMSALLQKTPLELMNIITSVGTNATKWNKRNRSKPTDTEEQRLMQEAEWLMEKSQSEAWESYAPEWKREEWARIVSTPIKSDGHVLIDLCMPNGKMRRFIQARSSLRMLPGLYTAVRKSTLGGIMPVYFQGHERMLSAEINAQKVLEEARREKSAKFEKAQKRRNQMDDDDDDDGDDVDFFGEDSAPPSKRGALTTKTREPTGGRGKTRVAKSLEELADGDGNMTFELNPTAGKTRSSPRRGARASAKEPEETGGQELDAAAKSALEDFKKMLAEQMSAAPSTPPRTRRTRRRRSGQESAEEASGTENGEINDSGSNSSSAVSDSTEEATEVKPRRGRRRPVY